MGNSLNQVNIIGNVTADPEIKTTQTDQKVATFAIATNRKWKDNAGVLHEEVEYHNIVAWGGLATITENYIDRGKKVYIQGHLKTRSWDGPDGTKRYRTEIVSDNIILLGSKGPQNDEQPAPPEPKRGKLPNEPISIEDIPF